MKIINKNLIFAEENIIAHGCNCQGKMGSGVAKAIRARFPEAYRLYVTRHSVLGLNLGEAQFVEVESDPIKFVANCMTQKYYGYDNKAYADLNAIKSSLTEVAEFAARYKYSVALPPIGCGLGGLSWSTVGPEIEKIFDIFQVKFQVYDYKAENWKT